MTPIKLRQWRARTAHVVTGELPEHQSHRHTTIHPLDALIVHPDDEMDVQFEQLLERAAIRAGAAHRLVVDPRPTIAGRINPAQHTPELARIVHWNIQVHIDGEIFDVQELYPRAIAHPDHDRARRASAINVAPTIITNTGHPRTETWPCDVCFIAYDQADWVRHVTPIVTTHSMIQIKDLADLLLRSFFFGADYHDPHTPIDSVQTLLELHREEAIVTAVQTLYGRSEATLHRLKRSTMRHLAPHVANGHSAHISIQTPVNDDKPHISVTLLPSKSTSG